MCKHKVGRFVTLFIDKSCNDCPSTVGGILSVSCPDSSSAFVFKDI